MRAHVQCGHASALRVGTKSSSQDFAAGTYVAMVTASIAAEHTGATPAPPPQTSSPVFNITDSEFFFLNLNKIKHKINHRQTHFLCPVPLL